MRFIKELHRTNGEVWAIVDYGVVKHSQNGTETEMYVVKLENPGLGWQYIHQDEVASIVPITEDEFIDKSIKHYYAK